MHACIIKLRLNNNLLHVYNLYKLLLDGKFLPWLQEFGQLL